MSEMVQRVALGIHAARANSRTKWDDCSEEYRTGTMRDAYAAIAAMREPTRAMISEGWDHEDSRMPTEMWQRMIDAALT
jgi:hypothetical protein